MIDLNNISKPVLAACQAWSYTDRRQMLTLLAAEPDNVAGRIEVEKVILQNSPSAFIARLAPVPVVWDQAPRRELRHLTISWSPRAPIRLKLESILFRSLREAQNWAECGVEEKPGRRILTLSALTEQMPRIFPF